VWIDFWIAAVVGSAEDAWPPRRVTRPNARVRMAVLIVALLGARLLVGGSDAAPAGGLRQLAVVTLEGEDRVAFVDLARGLVLRRLAVASGPHNLDATGDGRVVAVTSPPSGRVTILDGRRLRVLRVVSGFRARTTSRSRPTVARPTSSRRRGGHWPCSTRGRGAGCSGC